MSNSPWTVERTKRKKPTTTPASRKRVHISDDVGKRQSLSAKSKDQKTLTQIQWVNSPNNSFEDDVDLQEIGQEQEEGKITTTPKRRKLSKRNSTLTQMDWLGSFQVHQDNTMDMENSAMLDEQGHTRMAQISQIDGTYDSPRKKRTRKSGTAQTAGRSLSPDNIEKETRIHLSTRRQKRMANLEAETRPRRKSERIASKVLSHPNEHYGYLSQALPHEQYERTDMQLQRPPKLEIMDSTDPDNEQTPTQARLLPQTPRRKREVPSSQTPESMTRSKKRRQHGLERSESKILLRTPLQERSANVPSRSYSRGLEISKSMFSGTKSSPKRNKICVLKVPSRELLQRSGQTHGSQHDVYSLQATSSSDGSSSRLERPAQESLNELRVQQTEEAVEIPSTSQRKSSSDSGMPSSPPIVETEGSLPELTDLIPPREPETVSAPNEKPQEVHLHHQANKEDSVVVHDFGRPSSREANLPDSTENISRDVAGRVEADIMLLDEEIVEQSNFSPESVAAVVSNDDDSDLGSPVANDTQFNVLLLERTSSPRLNANMDTSNIQLKTTDSKVVTPAPFRLGLTSRPQNDGDETELNTETPIPTPRLVGCPVSPAGPVHSSSKGPKKNTFVLPPSTHQTNSHASATKVPLNDTVQASSSSSPLLPPARSTTRRSIHPASMPRPSQVSTQDPTQHYPQSFIPDATQHHNEVDRITIKDSSSVRLSQIPQHETQSQGLNLRLVEESDEDFDDLDLDPSSTPQGRQSARKPSSLQRKETGSSLRSIHPLSDDSREKDAETVLSSSPLLQATMSSQAQKRQQVDEMGPPSHRTAKRQVPRPEVVYDSDATSSPISSPTPPLLKRQYDPLPGFDNDTQSNFTRDGHVTAAYIHRQRETGAWPDWFVPEPFQVSDWQRPAERVQRKGKEKRT